MDKKEFIPLGCTKIYKNPNTIALCLKCAQAKLVNYGTFNEYAKCPHCSQKFSMRNSYNDLMTFTGNPEKQIFAIQLRELFDAIDMNNAQSFNEHINQIANALKTNVIEKSDVVEAFYTQRSNSQTLIDAVVALINQSAENKSIWITDSFEYLINVVAVEWIINKNPLEDNDFQNINNLLILGANLNGKDQFGNILLHKALSKNMQALALLLIDHGANVNERDNNGYTPLQYAMIYDMTEVVLSLIDHGAFVNERGNDVNTPLNMAISRNMKEVALSLIDHRADVNEKNNWHDTPLHKAISKNMQEVVDSLKLHGALK